MKKIAVFVPNWFWSSIPYDGLVLKKYLDKHFECDLLMFAKDIRLSKTFSHKEKYYFNKEFFVKDKNLVLIKNWYDFYKITENYSLIISTIHLSPKNLLPEHITKLNFKENIKCPFLVVDGGGSDILTSGFTKGTHFCVKGEKWREWLIKMEVPAKNVFTTGCPHYDYYLDDNSLPYYAKPLSERAFNIKYELDPNKKKVLVAPCNPQSHKEQFKENVFWFEALEKLCEKHNYEILIKTHPMDYVFYDASYDYNGVYKRIFDRDEPQYSVINKKIRSAKIIESQDHFTALKISDKLFNLSGSHVAWETYFTKTQSFSMNYEKQSYYAGAHYLPIFVQLPDQAVNKHITDIKYLFEDYTSPKEEMAEFIQKTDSMPNIKIAVEKILAG